MRRELDGTIYRMAVAIWQMDNSLPETANPSYLPSNYKLLAKAAYRALIKHDEERTNQ